MKVMKKQLKEDLVALAEKITLLKNQDRVSTGELQELAKRLYDKLAIYNFTESHLFSAAELRAKDQENELVKTAQKVEALSVERDEAKDKAKAASQAQTPAAQPTVEQEDTHDDHYNPTGMEYNDDAEAITEPNTEKIKDIVAQMPPETRQIDDLFAHVAPRDYKKNDMSDIGGVHYDQLPKFEPVSHRAESSEKPRSLNDRLKTGLNIGFNERMAFVKHLFEGSNSDYNRVLSQLNTLKNKEEAFNFVANMVKPDYNNWEGKEEYESKFLSLVEKKFE